MSSRNTTLTVKLYAIHPVRSMSGVFIVSKEWAESPKEPKSGERRGEEKRGEERTEERRTSIVHMDDCLSVVYVD